MLRNIGISAFLLLVSLKRAVSDLQSDQPVFVDRSNLTEVLSNNVFTIEFHDSNDVIHLLSQNETARNIFYVKLRTEILKYLNDKNIRKTQPTTLSTTSTTSTTTTTSTTSTTTSTTSTTETFTVENATSTKPSAIVETEATTSTTPPTSTTTTVPPTTPTTTTTTTTTTTAPSTATTATTTTTPTPTSTTPRATRKIIYVDPSASKRRRRDALAVEPVYPPDSLKFFNLNNHVRNGSLLVTLTLDAFNDDDLRQAIEHISDNKDILNETGLSVKTFYKGFPPEDENKDKDDDDNDVVVVVVDDDDRTANVDLIVALSLFFLLLLVIIIITFFLMRYCRKHNSHRFEDATVNHNHELAQPPPILKDSDGWIIPMTELSNHKNISNHDSNFRHHTSF